MTNKNIRRINGPWLSCMSCSYVYEYIFIGYNIIALHRTVPFGLQIIVTRPYKSDVVCTRKRGNERHGVQCFLQFCPT